MAYIPDINFRSLQRSKYTLIKKVSEVPFSSFGRLSMNSELSSRSAHKRIFSEENRLLKSPAKNYTPDIYITSFNHEVKKALNFINSAKETAKLKKNMKKPILSKSWILMKSRSKTLLMLCFLKNTIFLEKQWLIQKKKL